jgi:hypothetical protein
VTRLSRTSGVWENCRSPGEAVTTCLPIRKLEIWTSCSDEWCNNEKFVNVTCWPAVRNGRRHMTYEYANRFTARIGKCYGTCCIHNCSIGYLRNDMEWSGCVLRYTYGQTTWRLSDRYERLVTVAAEVLSTPRWKHLSQVSVPDSSSSRAVESIVWVTWTLCCLCFKILFYWQTVLYFIQMVHLFRSDAFWMTNRNVFNFPELWRSAMAWDYCN